MKNAACLAVALWCAACAADPQSQTAAAGGSGTPVFGRQAPPQVPASPRAAPGDGFELHLKRSGCYGSCPSYQVTIHGNGGVDYVGYSHVAVAGAQHGQADPAALGSLRARFADPATATPWGGYTRDKPGCGPWSSDMPGVTIEAYFDGRWRRIEHDLGCSGAPSTLQPLEQAIDAAAQSEQWVSGRSAY